MKYTVNVLQYENKDELEKCIQERFEAELVRSPSFKEAFDLCESEEVKDIISDIFKGTCVMMLNDLVHKRFMFTEEVNDVPSTNRKR